MNPSYNKHPQGLKENWQQFTLLVIVNAFVGGMVGMERSIFPQFAHEQFGIESTSAFLSFITAFGISKALANYIAGRFSNRYGRRILLIWGWVLALPVPFILISTLHWHWVIFANILLGVSQGLTWSSTVVMKIDLVGEKNRGFAMGINEFAGYLSIGLTALLTGWIAQKYGTSPYPFVIGIVLSILGFAFSVIWVKETNQFNAAEIKDTDNEIPVKSVFWETTIKNRGLSAVTQAGMINNLNDGMIWGLLPIFLLQLQFSDSQIGWSAAIYPAVWGFGQLFTGSWADKFSIKQLLFWGMLLQGIGLLVLPMATNFVSVISISATLGFGTAMVYPTFLTAIAKNTSAIHRAESIGTFRLWRDLGYALGAIISGILADRIGIGGSISVVALLTIFSAVTVKLRFPNT
jgi:MFS family permease